MVTACIDTETGTIDCFADSERFMSAWDFIEKTAKFKQEENNLRISEGNYKGNVPLLLPVLLPKDITFTPRKGKEITLPEDWSSRIESLSPFVNILKNFHSDYMFFINKTLYNSDSVIATRIKCDDVDLEDFVVPTLFFTLCRMTKQEVQRYVFTEKTVAAIFENCWIQIAKASVDQPTNFVEVFKDFNKTKLYELPEKQMIQLAKLTAGARPDDHLVLKNKIASLVRDTEIVHEIKIDHGLEVTLSPQHFSKIVKMNPKLGMHNKRLIAFASPDDSIQGFLSTITTS